MINVHPECIVDENLNRKSVVLPYSEWENIAEEMEELDDIRAYDQAKNETEDEVVPFEQAVKEIEDGIAEKFQLLFENFTPVTGIFIRRKVEEVITNFEPRARISQVAVNEQPDRNGIEVTVYFYVMNMPNPVSVTTVLQRIR